MHRNGMPPESAESPKGRSLQCLEVWGGNRSVSEAVHMPGLDAWVYSRPYDGADGGGDIHYVSSCATGRITRLLVADVSGHGAKVSGVATALRDLMRRHINNLDQAKLIRGLNREFSQLETDGRFATAIAATYWAPTDTLVLCNAGHPRPLWYNSATDAWSMLRSGLQVGGRCGSSRRSRRDDDDPGDLPLGVIESSSYSQMGLKLSGGDLVLFYTDSLMEARSPDGGMLGEEGILRLLRGLDASRPATLVPALLEELDRYTCGGRVGDDVTMLVIRPNGDKPRASIVGGFIAVQRGLDGLVRRVLGRPAREGRPLAGAGPVAWPEIVVQDPASPFWTRRPDATPGPGSARGG